VASRGRSFSVVAISRSMRVVELTRRARAWLVEQSVEPVLNEAPAPFANRFLVHAEPAGDLVIRYTLRACQNDA
jgi:hypothetical protein